MNLKLVRSMIGHEEIGNSIDLVYRQTIVSHGLDEIHVIRTKNGCDEVENEFVPFNPGKFVISFRSIRDRINNDSYVHS